MSIIIKNGKIILFISEGSWENVSERGREGGKRESLRHGHKEAEKDRYTHTHTVTQRDQEKNDERERATKKDRETQRD